MLSTRPITCKKTQMSCPEGLEKLPDEALCNPKSEAALLESSDTATAPPTEDFVLLGDGTTAVDGSDGSASAVAEDPDDSLFLNGPLGT